MPTADRDTPPSFARTISGNRSVGETDGQFIVPTDTPLKEWDLDPNADGDFVIPDDIEGRSDAKAPAVGAADVISFGIESQDGQNLSFQLDWLDAPDGTSRITENTDDSDLFGPDTYIRTNMFTIMPWVRITVTSEVAAGTQNRFTMGMEAH